MPLTLDERLIRALPAAFSEQTHQEWFSHVVKDKWSSAKRMTAEMVNRKISPHQWADAVHMVLFEAHANASFIGRDLLKGTEFADVDVLRARAVLDTDADYFLNFLDDIVNGRYTDEAGSLRFGPITSRLNLYFGKVRSTCAEASVDGTEKDTEIFWRLGGVEVHCADCPHFAAISPFFKDDLFATPGSGDTPCLGNCKCHLEFTFNDRTVETIKPVRLTNDLP